MKRIAIIGAGGRIGSMFSQELKIGNSVLGVDRNQEIERIRSGNVVLMIGGKETVFEVETINDYEIVNHSFDAVFLCAKNPVTDVVKYYYRMFKEGGKDIPALFLPQNGVTVIEETMEALKDIFGKDAEKVKIARISLFNSVSREIVGEKVYLKYSLPIRLAVGPVSDISAQELKEFFNDTEIEVFEISRDKVRDMEFSKLFLNLIGMASACHDLSIEDGFSSMEIFKEELGVIKEYTKIVENKGGKFVDFPHYPVGLMSAIFNNVPVAVLSLFRKWIGRKIEKGRRGKKKDIDEIEYYNGMVVNMGREIGISTPFNEKVVKIAKEKMLKDN